MYIGKTLFAQLMDFLPWKTFHRIIDRHDGDRYIKSMTCADQFRVLVFAQLTYRESLRDDQTLAFFVSRAKSNTRFRRVYSAALDRNTGIICNQTIALTGTISGNDYPVHLRSITGWFRVREGLN